MSNGTAWLRSQARKVSAGEDLLISTGDAAAVSVEGWLQSRGVRYAPPAPVPMDLIDERRSRANQARRDPLVPESVDRFAAALRAGAAFPPIVTYPLGGRLVIIDGNNRHAAARRVGLDTIAGIVVAEDTASEVIQLLTVEANSNHGVTPEVSWRITQAHHLNALGFNDTEAAEAAGVSIQQLRTARAVRDADDRARKLRINGFTDLSSAARQTLGALRDEMVFLAAAKVAVDTGMATEEVRDLIRYVKTLSSEKARLKHIADFTEQRQVERAKRRAAGKVGRRVSSVKHSFVSAAGKLEAVDPLLLQRQILTTTDRDNCVLTVKRVRQKLEELEVALGLLRLEEEG